MEIPEKPSLDGLEQKWSARWEADEATTAKLSKDLARIVTRLGYRRDPAAPLEDEPA